MAMNQTTASSLTFNIQSGSQIQGIIHLVQQEIRKEACLESEVTLVSTALSEMCRKFIEHSSSMELTLSLLSQHQHIRLHGKATSSLTSENIPWQQITASLNTCFTETDFQKHNDSAVITYSFCKTILCK